MNCRAELTLKGGGIKFEVFLEEMNKLHKLEEALDVFLVHFESQKWCSQLQSSLVNSDPYSDNPYEVVILVSSQTLQWNFTMECFEQFW